MLNILVVDDSRLARKRVIQTLEDITSIDCNVVAEAVDGVDGLKKFNELKPDIVISDIEMPNMNGIELTQEICKIDNSVCIIVISSVANEQIKQSVKINSFSNYLKKPIDQKQLEITLLRFEKHMRDKE